MSGYFNAKDLKRIVELTGQMLESEDRFILSCFQGNPAYHESRQSPGIMLMSNEWYWQRVTLRALLPSFPYEVELEYGKKRFDIAFFRRFDDPLPVAVGEMKLWMSGSGKGELRWIQRDISKLSTEECTQFLIIFMMSEPGETDQQVEWLLNAVGHSDKARYPYPFSSIHLDPRRGKLKGEFAVVGVLLKR